MQKLSIITPTLNCAKTLEATLLSIRPLVLGGAEHIVVDSGSTDGTVQLAEDSGAKVIFHPKGNMYAAINAGMQIAQGDFFTYINGDDVLYADAIIDMLDKFPATADVAYGNIDLIDDFGRFLFHWRSPSPTMVAPMFKVYCCIYQQGSLFRKRVYEELSGFDTQYRYSADLDFFFRASDCGHKFWKYSNKTVAAFRLMATQLSQFNKEEMAPEGRRIRNQHWEGKSAMKRKCYKLYSFIYRNLINLDSRYLKKNRGLGIDQRKT